MHIDTTSHETMMTSLTSILCITNQEINQVLQDCYDKFEADHQFLDMDDQYDFFLNYVKNHLINEINEVGFYHLSRRLNEDHDDNGCSFVDVLTKETSLSNYLKKYQLTFQYDEHIKMFISNKEINIKENPYFIDRFGYLYHDYAITGYAFKDHIKESDYYQIAMDGPEFFWHLYECNIDDDSLIDHFIEHSKFYLFAYSVPLTDIEFESYEELDEKEKMYHMAVITLQRLYFEQYDPVYVYQENQVMKMKDGKILNAAYLVSKVELVI